MELLQMARFEIPQQMKEWSLWALWWFLVGGGVLWLLVGSVAYWVRKGWLPPDAAGWVQAMGSIAAIAVAVGIPIYLRLRERADMLLERAELDQCRSEQLIALCDEGVRVMGSFDQDAVFSDYDVSNSLQLGVLNDLLARLNEAQKTELNAGRMGVAMELRFSIHDWIKYFSGKEVPEVGKLHNRVTERLPELERIKIEAQNILRKQRGLSLIERPAASKAPEDDIPY